MISPEDRITYGLQVIWRGGGPSPIKSKKSQNQVFCANIYVLLLQIMYFPESLSICYIIITEK